jgi:hypothetical protein
MGEIAEMMINGEMCQDCGCFFEDGESPGYPRSCCDDEPDQKQISVSDKHYEKLAQLKHKALTSIASVIDQVKKIDPDNIYADKATKSFNRLVIHTRGLLKQLETKRGG